MMDIIEEFLYMHTDKPINVRKLKDPERENTIYQVIYYEHHINHGIEFPNKFDDTLTPNKLKDHLATIDALRKS